MQKNKGKYISLAIVCMVLFCGGGVFAKIMKQRRYMRAIDERQILSEEKDLRFLFCEKEDVISLEKSSMCHMYICFDANGYGLSVTNGMTVKDALLWLDKVRPKKMGVSYVVSRQPQMKIIKKNSLHQSEWLKPPSASLLSLPLCAGDLIYVSAYD